MKNGPGIDPVYMFNQLRTMEKFKKIYHGETTEEHWPIDIENSGPEIWGIEEIFWYDGIAYYENKNTGQRYSRAGYPIANDEMCLYGDVCKVEKIQDGPEKYDFHWKILSRRPDGDGKQSPEMPQPTGARE